MNEQHYHKKKLFKRSLNSVEIKLKKEGYPSLQIFAIKVSKTTFIDNLYKYKSFIESLNMYEQKIVLDRICFGLSHEHSFNLRAFYLGWGDAFDQYYYDVKKN